MFAIDENVLILVVLFLCIINDKPGIVEVIIGEVQPQPVASSSSLPCDEAGSNHQGQHEAAELSEPSQDTNIIPTSNIIHEYLNTIPPELRIDDGQYHSTSYVAGNSHMF